MGMIKLKKAAGFDLVSADNVGAVKIVSNDVVIEYTTGYKCTIAGASNLVEADVELCLGGIDEMNGASGKANEIIALSSLVTGTTVASL